MDYQEAITCAALCQDVYQDLDNIQLQGFSHIRPHIIEKTETDTQCIVVPMVDTMQAYIAFRGSEKKADWNTNFDWKKQTFEFEQQVIESARDQGMIYPYGNTTRRSVEMHQGFVKAYLSVRDAIHQHITAQNYTSVIVTGHSLGGAIATLCVLDLQYNFFDSNVVKLYTFGCPRVGNADFRESFSQRVPQSYRIINGMDIVPALPRPWQGYRHIDQEYRVGRRFSFRFISQRIRDHSISLYLEQLRQI